MPGAKFQTALGECGLEWNERGLRAFRLPQDHALQDLPLSESNPSWAAELISRVQAHLSGTPQDFANAPYDFTVVTEFQRAVYEAALTVKAGETRTYGWIAEKLGQAPAVSRAVGTALGQNPWPLLVPCHRFIAANGKMTGFSGPGGIETKIRLLALEGSELPLL